VTTVQVSSENKVHVINNTGTPTH